MITLNYSKFLSEKFKKTFPKERYNVEVNLVDDIVERIKITDILTKNTAEMEVSQDDLDELDEIKAYEDHIVIGKNSLTFALVDKKKLVTEEIIIRGPFDGTITKGKNYFGLITNNLETMVDIEKVFKDNFFSISEIINDHFVVCDITLPGIDVLYGKTEEVDLYTVNKIIHSVLTYMSYNLGIVLEIPNNAVELINIKKTGNEIRYRINEELEPMQYFLMAENAIYPHMKYIDYYHVIEYFFLENSIKDIEVVIKELVRLELTQNRSFVEGEYHQQINRLRKFYIDGRGDPREPDQIRDVISNLLGYELIKDILNDKIGMEINKLAKPYLTVERTKLENFNNVYDSGEKKLKDSPTEEAKKAFCNDLSVRIYKIRNYLVHTKKGESDYIFTPVRKVFEELEFDIKIIRNIAFALITHKR